MDIIGINFGDGPQAGSFVSLFGVVWLVNSQKRIDSGKSQLRLLLGDKSGIFDRCLCDSRTCNRAAIPFIDVGKSLTEQVVYTRYVACGNGDILALQRGNRRIFRLPQRIV